MNIKHKKLVIPENDPFANCKLNRSKNAEMLTSIVETYADGFVLAINNKWGTGKTTFIEMWQQLLINQGFKTLYFNAWENDFENDPLIALIGELRTLTSKKKSETFKSLTKKAGILSKNILPTLLGAVASKYLELENFEELIKKTTDAGIEIFEDEVEKYSSKKNDLNDFRKTLIKYIEELKSEKPIIFIIDELDRCRPNYAVEVLEKIKHFFNVPNIIFVLSIDKDQLGQAIKGVYGSENLDTQEYLRRFIDLEYQLPEPDIKSFCEYLIQYYDFNSFFASEQRLPFSQLRNDSSDFVEISANLFNNSRVTLRQAEQIFAYARIVLLSFNFNSFIFPQILVFLISLKLTNTHLFNNIKSRSLTIKDLNDELNVLLPDSLEYERMQYPFMYLQAEIIYRYHLYYDPNNKVSIIVNGQFNEGLEYDLKSKYDTRNENKEFKKALSTFAKDFHTSRVDIGFILNKINLIDNINT